VRSFVKSAATCGNFVEEKTHARIHVRGLSLVLHGGQCTVVARGSCVSSSDFFSCAQGAVILGAIYYKWRSLLPLVLQTVMTPLNLMDSPLFQIYMLQRNVNRPFPKPNPFGLPEAPAAPTETPELEAVANPTELTCLAAAFGVARDVSGAICCAQPSAAEEELSNKSDMDGKVAVVTRGIVPFIDKARRVADAGAVALIVVNSEEACYKCTAPNEDCSDLNIPVVCVGCSDGQALKDGVKVRMAMAEGKVTLVENAAAAEGKKER
jgi:hypothetical protein